METSLQDYTSRGLSIMYYRKKSLLSSFKDLPFPNGTSRNHGLKSRLYSIQFYSGKKADNVDELDFGRRESRLMRSETQSIICCELYIRTVKPTE
ncbi:hypothetical protein RB195_003992 [Necator americanus]|uniref:Uncharacterized protein n=1 Tax=Necator americanus TaxID=51031 RepID=A0ABR1DSM1_NECAM